MLLFTLVVTLSLCLLTFANVLEKETYRIIHTSFSTVTPEFTAEEIFNEGFRKMFYN